MTVVLRPYGRPCCLVTLTPDTLFSNTSENDSVHIEIWIITVDSPHVGIPGILPALSASGGGRLHGSGASDSAGYISLYWFTNFQGFGRDCFFTNPPPCNGDTACVVVMDTTSGGRSF
jgi:hypothetical protein